MQKYKVKVFQKDVWVHCLSGASWHQYWWHISQCCGFFIYWFVSKEGFLTHRAALQRFTNWKIKWRRFLIRRFLWQLQLHLWGSPSLCADGERGPQGPTSAGWLDRGRWDFLSGGLNLQHVCHEPRTLSTLSRGQKPGGVGSPTAKHLYISRGEGDCSPVCQGVLLMQWKLHQVYF